MNNLEGYVNRTEKLKMYQVEAKVLRYIKNRIKNVDFSFWNIEYRPVEELIDQGYLEGWCFQTAEFLALKFEDDDSLVRGNLKLNNLSDYNYYHSWLEISYQGKQYVFDPCLQIICPKLIYYQTYEVEKELAIKTSKLKEIFYQSTKNQSSSEIFIGGSSNPSDPFYKTNSTIKYSNEPEKLKVRFH